MANDTDVTNTALAPRAGTAVRRDFGGETASMTSSTTEAMIAARRADVEARWVVAMRAPRNMDMVRQDILDECKRPLFAEVAEYSKPVGSKFNEDTGQWEQQYAVGFSIRFAEVAMRHMRNMQCRTSTIHEDDRSKTILVQAVDFESNSTWDREITIAKTVERSKPRKGQKIIRQRENSKGKPVFVVEASEAEFAQKEAAEISKVSRTAIMRLIPGNIQDEARHVLDETRAATDKRDPNAARNRVVDAFRGVGIKVDQLELWLGHGMETISPAEIDQLRGIYAAIKEGEMVWADTLADRMTNRDDAATSTAADGTAPAPAPAKASRGTAALNGHLKNKQASAAAKTTPPATPVEKPAENGPAPGFKDVDCTKCGGLAEVPIDFAGPAVCGDCSSAGREE